MVKEIKTREERILEQYKFPWKSGFPKLYKYRSMASDKEIGRLEEVFRERKIYLSSPLQLNDPFECRPQIIWYRRTQDLIKYFSTHVAERFPGAYRKIRREEERKAAHRFRSNQNGFIKDAYNDFMEATGLYCLSQINDDLLMWSHYSDGHRGIVLEYGTTKEDTLFWEAFDVHYSEEYPVVNIMKIGEPEEYRNLLLTKFIQWEYEKEWRIIRAPNEGAPGKYRFAPELLTGVIMGASITLENREKLLSWVRDYPREIDLYQANINKTKYQLDIEKV
jgi:hypothetical protein